MTSQEFDLHVLSLIDGESRLGNRDLTLAHLGMLIKRTSPNSWTDQGYPNLKPYLAELELRGLVRLFDNEKNIICVVRANAEQSNVTEGADYVRMKRHPIRRQIWSALVSATPTGPRYLNTSTGAVLLSGVPEVQQTDWFEFQRIPQDTQKNWFRSFMETAGLEITSHIENALQLERWYTAVPALLDAANRVKFNRYRTQQVYSHLVQLANQNRLDAKLLFDQSPSLERNKQTLDRVLVPKRQLILDALSAMPTDELLEISIPLKYVFGEEPNGSGQ